MIVYGSTHWLGMVVRVHGSVVKRIWPRFVVTTAIAAALTWLQRDPRFHMSLTVPPFVITGLPLGIILGFRNSSSYDHYCDGRKLWGALTNQCRSLVRQLHTLVDAPDGASDAQREELAALRKEVTYRLVGFVLALRLHLRREKDPALLATAPTYSLGPEEHLALVTGRDWNGRYVGGWHTHAPKEMGGEWVESDGPSFEDMQNAVRFGQFLTLSFQPDGFDLYDAGPLADSGRVDLSLHKVIRHRSDAWRRHFEGLRPRPR